MSIFNYLRFRFIPPEKKPPPKNHVDVYFDPETGELVKQMPDNSTSPISSGVTEQQLIEGLATKVDRMGDTVSGNLIVEGYIEAQAGLVTTGSISINEGNLEVTDGEITLSGEFARFSGPASEVQTNTAGSYRDTEARYVSVLSSRALTTAISPATTDNGKIITAFGTDTIVLTLPDDNSSNPSVLEIANYTNGAGTLTLTAASSVQVNGVTAGSVALPRYSRSVLKRIGFDTWAMQVDEAPLKGPYADDSAAATAGVVIGERYYKAAGTVHVRLT